MDSYGVGGDVREREHHPCESRSVASDIQAWQPANVLPVELGKENLRDTTHSNPVLMRNGCRESNNRPMLNAETLGALATVDDESGWMKTNKQT